MIIKQPSTCYVRLSTSHRNTKMKCTPDYQTARLCRHYIVWKIATTDHNRPTSTNRKMNVARRCYVVVDLNSECLLTFHILWYFITIKFLEVPKITSKNSWEEFLVLSFRTDATLRETAYVCDSVKLISRTAQWSNSMDGVTITKKSAGDSKVPMFSIHIQYYRIGSQKSEVNNSMKTALHQPIN